MAVSFEPWSEAMRPVVLATFGPPTHWTIAQGRSAWREPNDSERWSRALVLADAGRPTAVAGAFHAELHPTREWCYVEVGPQDRGRGYGHAVLMELRRQLPGHARPLRSKVRAGSAGERFARKHGFQPIQRTRRVAVTVSSAALDRDVSRCNVRAGEEPPRDEAAMAWGRYYAAGHDWDPPGDLSADQCRKLFLTPADRVLVAIRADDIVGIASLRFGEPRPTFVGGAVGRRDPDAVEIAAALLDRAAKLTADRCLDIELDDWMWEVARAIEPWGHEVIDEACVVAGAGATGRPDEEAAQQAQAGIPPSTIAFRIPAGTVSLGGEILSVPPELAVSTAPSVGRSPPSRKSRI